MLLDNSLLFSAHLTLTAGATGAINSTNIIDFGPLDSANTNPAIGNADQFLLSIVSTAGASTGAATLAITWETDDNSAMSSAASIWAPTGTLALAALSKGAVLIKARLPRGLAYQRYNRLVYTNGAHVFSAGMIFSAITPDADSFIAFARETETFG